MGDANDQSTSLLQKAFIGACTIIVSLCGLVVGLWSHSLETAVTEVRDSQRAIWRIIGERASLPARTAELEKRSDDQERRLREAEVKIGRSRW